MDVRRRVVSTVRSNSALLLCCLGAGILMTWGIWSVRPVAILPDEAGAIERALRMGIEGNPLIEGFRKGGNLHLYLLAGTFVPYVAFLVLTGTFGDVVRAAAEVQATGVNPWTGPEVFVSTLYDFVVLGRLLSVLAGLVTVVAVYLLARRCYGHRAGIVSAGLLSVSMLFVNTMHFATEDALLGAFVVLTLLFVVRYRQTHRRRELLLAAALSGLAVSTKATAGVLLFPLVLAFCHRVFVDRDLDLFSTDGITAAVAGAGAYVAVAALAYVATTPSILLYPETWLTDVVFELGNRSSVFAPSEPGWIVQAANLANGLGLPLFVLVLAGVAFAVRRQLDAGLSDVPESYLLAFAGLTFLVVGSWDTADPWYVFPLIPILAVFAGGLVDRRLGTATPDRLVLGVLAVVVVFSLAYTGVAMNQFANDSRMEATTWMERNVEGGSAIDTHATRHYLPAFPADARVTRIPVYSFTNETERNRAVQRVDCRVPDYVVLSRFHYGRYVRNPDAYPEVTRFFTGLLDGDGDYERVAAFGPAPDPAASAWASMENSLTPQVFSADPRIVVLQRTAPVDQQCATGVAAR